MAQFIKSNSIVKNVLEWWHAKATWARDNESGDVTTNGDIVVNILAIALIFLAACVMQTIDAAHA